MCVCLGVAFPATPLFFAVLQSVQAETFAKPGTTKHAVIPAQAGILPEFRQNFVFQELFNLNQDSRLRGNDGIF